MTAPLLSLPLFSYPAAPGGLLYTYAAGGTSPVTTYSDAAGTVPNSNPVVLDAFGNASVRALGAFHFVLKDSTGVTTLWDEDYYLPAGSAYPFGAVANIAAAATTDIGSVNSNYVNVTGGATISSFGSSATKSAPIFVISFDSACNLTQSGNLALPGSRSLTLASGDFILAEYSGGGAWYVIAYFPVAGFGTTRTAVKSGSTSRANSASLTIDPDLFISLIVGTWAYEVWINDAGGTSTGGLQAEMAFSGTSSAGSWSGQGSGTNAMNAALTALGAGAQIQGTQDGTLGYRITGFVVVTAAGSIDLFWAQHTSNGTASIVGAGSWIRATRLA